MKKNCCFLALTVIASMAIATVAHAQPANDLCANAIPIGNHSVTPWDTTGAGTEGTISCSTSSTRKDIWYYYAASGEEVVTIHTCGSAGRSKDLTAFWGGCGGPELACNETFLGEATASACSSEVTQAQIQFETPGAGIVFICLTTRGSTSTPTGLLHLDAVPVVRPANDACENAQVLPGPGSYPYDPTRATFQGPRGSCGDNGLDFSSGAADFADVFFKYTAGNEGYITIDTLTPPVHDTTMQVFSACGGTELACSSNVAVSFGMNLFGSRICSLPVTNGTTYIIRVACDGPEPAQPGVLTLSFAGPPLPYSPPANAVDEPGVCGEPFEADQTAGPDLGTYADIDVHLCPTYKGTSAQRPEWGRGHADRDWYRFTLSTPEDVTVSGQTQFQAILYFTDETGGLTDIHYGEPGCGAGNFSWTSHLHAGTWRFLVNHWELADDSRCGHNEKYWVHFTGSTACPPTCPADIGQQGGLPGADTFLDNNDFVVFIDFFFGGDSRADFGVQGGTPGQDGQFDNNDFVVFIDAFFDGCP